MEEKLKNMYVFHYSKQYKVSSQSHAHLVVSNQIQYIFQIDISLTTSDANLTGAIKLSL